MSMYRRISPQNTMSVRLWAFLSCIAVVKTYGSPNLVLDFLSVFSGKWDNRAGVQAGLTNAIMNARFVPVDLPAFRYKTMVYFENALKGRVLSLFLCEVIKDKSSNNTVLLIPYLFTNGSKYKAGEFDLDDLYDLTPGNLTSFKQCTSPFQTSGNGTFSGPCPQCNDSMNRPHLVCRLTFSCDIYTLERPPSAKETGRVIRDVFNLNGPRYPLVHVPKGYVSPCAKRNRKSTKGKNIVKENKKY